MLREAGLSPHLVCLLCSSLLLRRLVPWLNLTFDTLNITLLPPFHHLHRQSSFFCYHKKEYPNGQLFNLLESCKTQSRIEQAINQNA
jgi:hypothetical protein